MPEIMTTQDFVDGRLDVKSLGEAANGDENTQVVTRTGETYPSAKKAIKTMFVNGGLPAQPFATKALMTASTLANGSYAQVTDETANNGLYLKTAGAWVKSGYDPTGLAKTYTDTVIYDLSNKPKLSIHTFYYTSADKGQVKRIIKPLKLTKGKRYKISLSFNKDLKASSSVTFSLKTLPSNDYLQVIDTVYYAEGLVKKGIQEFILTPTQDATYYYIYINDNTAGDLQIDVNVEEAGLFQEEINNSALMSVLPRVYDVFHNTVGLQRFVIENKFIAGRRYNVAVQFDSVGIRTSGTTTIYSFKTTSSSNYADVVDVAIELNQASMLSKELKFSFTATADATHLYMYVNIVADIRIKTSITDETLLLENAAQLSTMYSSLKAVSENTATGLQYKGEKLRLTKNSYSLNSLMTLTKPSGVTDAFQGADVYNGLLFACFHTGVVGVYDFTNHNKTPLAKFNLGSFGTGNHANCANFSRKFYAGNTQFPLLYVTGGNDVATMRCEVENITESGGVYSSTRVQSITFSQDGFAAAGLEEIWGWPNWLVDAENGFIYVFTSRYRSSLTEHYDDNAYIANKYRLPDPTTGDVTIGLAELVEQKVFNFDTHYTQSGCVFDNKIIYVYGLGSVAFPFNIRVYDLLTNSLSSSINVATTSEPESCFVLDGKLFVVMVDGKVLEFLF